MNCDQVMDLLPDHTLGMVSDVEAAAIRRHLRGCASCRAEATDLEEGLAAFAGAAHAIDPPPELRQRVMAVLSDEWAEGQVAPPSRRARFIVRLTSVAAAVAVVAGALAWGISSTATASRFREDAASYQHFLHALGGKDVRVAALLPQSTAEISGEAIMYDSDHDQSWVLVLVKAPGLEGPLNVQLASSTGRVISLRPMDLDAGGDGSAWLVTSADLSRFDSVRLIDGNGTLVASGATGPADIQ